MPSELLLIGNPARRRRKSAKRRTRSNPVSPAQRAARAKFAAMARGRTSPNPIRRRRRSAAVSRRRVRRNPIGGSVMRGLGPMVKSAAYGAAGALAVDVGYGFALPYLPAMIQTPVAVGGGINPAYYLGKGAFTIALGVLGKKVLGPKAGPMVEGALAVLLHDAGKRFIEGSGMGVTMGFMPGGRILPQLPAARSLRMYTNDAGRASMLPGNAQNAPMLGQYVGGRMQSREGRGVR